MGYILLIIELWYLHTPGLDADEREQSLVTMKNILVLLL